MALQGSGVLGDPWLISDYADFSEFCTIANSGSPIGYFALTADIDLDGNSIKWVNNVPEWNMDGRGHRIFNGVLNGHLASGREYIFGYSPRSVAGVKNLVFDCALGNAGDHCHAFHNNAAGGSIEYKDLVFIDPLRNRTSNKNLYLDAYSTNAGKFKGFIVAHERTGRLNTLKFSHTPVGNYFNGSYSSTTGAGTFHDATSDPENKSSYPNLDFTVSTTEPHWSIIPGIGASMLPGGAGGTFSGITTIDGTPVSRDVTILSSITGVTVAMTKSDPDTGAWSAFVSIADLCVVTAYDAMDFKFPTDTALTLDTLVAPSTLNGFRYRVTTAGTTDATEPTWPLSEGLTVTSGTVEFTAEKVYEPVTHGPLIPAPVA